MSWFRASLLWGSINEIFISLSIKKRLKYQLVLHLKFRFWLTMVCIGIQLYGHLEKYQAMRSLVGKPKMEHYITLGEFDMNTYGHREKLIPRISACTFHMLAWNLRVTIMKFLWRQCKVPGKRTKKLFGDRGTTKVSWIKVSRYFEMNLYERLMQVKKFSSLKQTENVSCKWIYYDKLISSIPKAPCQLLQLRKKIKRRIFSVGKGDEKLTMVLLEIRGQK